MWLARQQSRGLSLDRNAKGIARYGIAVYLGKTMATHPEMEVLSALMRTKKCAHLRSSRVLLDLRFSHPLASKTRPTPRRQSWPGF
jgi:hypothetical protein